MKSHVVRVSVARVPSPAQEAQVTIRVGNNLIESVITRQSAEELGLKKGDTVAAVVKATEVMISKG